MNNIYYKKIQKMDKKENERYHKLEDNRNMDSSLLSSEDLAFTIDRRRRRRKHLQTAERLFLSVTL